MVENNKLYKASELCVAFGQPVLRGSRLTTFIRQLEKEYKIIKKGQWYSIERELTDEEKRQLEIKGFYQKVIETVLSEILSNELDYTCCFSMMEMLLGLNMVTDDYKYCKYNINQTALILETDPNEIEQYIKISYDLLSSLIKNVLRSLNDKSLIIYSESFKVYNRHEGKMVNIRAATKQEESTILEIRREVFDELGVTGKNELYSYKRYLIDSYKTKCIEKCRLYGLDFYGFFDAYKLTLNRVGLKQNSKKVRQELNGKIQQKLLTASGLKEIADLELLVDATINPKRPYKIKEGVKKP